MRYLPTVDLWDATISAAIHSGQLKLQSGQWVRCGSDNLSRFAYVTRSKHGAYIRAYHYPHATASYRQFIANKKAWEDVV